MEKEGLSQAAVICLAIARFEHTRDNRVQQEEHSWERLSELLTQHEERAQKDGPLWSPTLYKSGATRAAANVIAVTCLVLDFDSGVAAKDFAQGWGRWEYVMHTTFQHTPEKPRWRVVFPLRKAINADQWSATWVQLAARLGGNFADRTCKDASRIYYLPACLPGAVRGGTRHAGEWLDPGELLRPTVRYLVQRAGEHLPEGRNAAGMWLACQLRDNGYTHSEAEAANWHLEVPREKQHPDGKVDLYTRNEWQETVRKAYGRSKREAWRPGTNGRQEEEPKPEEAAPFPTFAELIDETLIPPRWIVEGILPAGLTIFFGRPKMRKSWLALSLSVAKASAGYALGKIPVERCDVLYIGLEDSKYRLQDRLKKTVTVRQGLERVYYQTSWPRFGGDGGGLRLKEFLDQHSEVGYVVLDPFAKIRERTSGGQISAYDADYVAGEYLLRITQEFDVGLMVLHHSRKAKADDWLDEINGSQGIAGSADTIWYLEAVRGEEIARLRVTGRDVKSEDYHLEWDEQVFGWTMKGTEREFGGTRERYQIKKVLRDAGRPLMKREWYALTVEKLGQRSFQGFCQLVDRMLDEAELVDIGSAFWFRVEGGNDAMP